MNQNEIYTDLEGYNATNSLQTDEDAETAMYNYVFHYNYYTKLWNAIPRDHYLEYWSNTAPEAVLKSKSLNTLVEIIQRTQGNPSLIEQLTREQ